MRRTKSNKTKETKILIQSPSVFRRFASIVYDAFIVVSFLILATTAALMLNRGRSLDPYPILFPLYLLISTGLFLAWFWTKGQTLGMLAWNLRMLTRENQPLTWQQAFCRYGACVLSLGLAGLGFLWCLVDRERQTLHDRLSKTQVVHLKKVSLDHNNHP